MECDGTAEGWQVFIAYPSVERSAADALYGHLTAGGVSVFLDHMELALGDPWAARIAHAQKTARITVVLVSSASDSAFYQRDEIARGLEMARRGVHRVVPIYLDDEADPPYGLLALQAARVTEAGGLAPVADRVLSLLRARDDLRSQVSDPQPGSKRPIPLPSRGSPFRPGMPLYATDRYSAESRRRLLDAVRDDIRRGTNVNLVGERRMGRTSLLNHLYAGLLVDPGVAVTRVNVQDGVDDADGFWGSLLWGLTQTPQGVDVIGPQRRKEVDEEPAAAYVEVRRVLRTLRTQVTVVVLVDEFERCFDSPGAFPLPGFFDNLRSLLGGDAYGPYARTALATRRSLAEYFATRQVTSVLPTYLPPRPLEPLLADDAEEVLAQSRHHLTPAQRSLATTWADGHPCRLQCAGEAWHRALDAGRDLEFAEEEYRRLSGQLCIGAAQPT